MNKSDFLVSIIVPVYNVEKYLSRCLDSIVNQTYSNLEIVLVDDGSTDNSSGICDNYSNMDSRFHVFHLENGGVSSARNYGIDMANGDYIMFVDSDDYLLQDAIEVCVNAVKSKSGVNVDIVLGYLTSSNVCSKKDCTNVSEIGKPKILNDKEKLLLIGHLFDLKSKEYNKRVKWITRGCYSKLLRSELVRMIKFDEDLTFGEDQIWYLELFNYNPTIIIVENLLYVYCRNPDSSTKRFRPTFKKYFEEKLIVLLCYAKKYNAYGNYFNYLWEAIEAVFNDYYWHKDSRMSPLQVFFDYLKLSNTYPWNLGKNREFLRGLGTKGLIKYLLLKTNTSFFYFYLKKFKKELLGKRQI